MVGFYTLVLLGGIGSGWGRLRFSFLHVLLQSVMVGANESSRFWLGMLNDLKNRGVQDVLFFCVDGLLGFRDAIHTKHSFRFFRPGY